MKYYVYELFNELGSVEYVGESRNPKKRLVEHKSTRGKFIGRTDITMRVIDEYPTQREAYVAQCILQKQYGMITDSEIRSLANKGKSPWNKGKTASETTKLKMSTIKKGNQYSKGKHTGPHSEETKSKMKAAWIKRKQVVITI